MTATVITSNTEAPEVGDFIDIPTWNATGCVMVIEPSMSCGFEFDVLLQERPDAPSNQWRLYRLNRDQFYVL